MIVKSAAMTAPVVRLVLLTMTATDRWDILVGFLRATIYMKMFMLGIIFAWYDLWIIRVRSDVNSYIFSNGAFPDVVNTPATVSQQKIQTIMFYAPDFLIGIILQHKQSTEFVLFLWYFYWEVSWFRRLDWHIYFYLRWHALSLGKLIEKYKKCNSLIY